ncbi:MAG TPA: hypothetical protein VK919_06880 [Solirubrobacterales bacterium]|nr:hypothetical protein [Solirubrobacterales bacterium]
MTVWWIGNAVLLLVVVPVVVVLLRGVLEAAKRTRAAVEELGPVARAASADLDAVEMLRTTRTQVNQTVTVVADYGGSLDTILDDA